MRQPEATALKLLCICCAAQVLSCASDEGTTRRVGHERSAINTVPEESGMYIGDNGVFTPSSRFSRRDDDVPRKALLGAEVAFPTVMSKLDELSSDTKVRVSFVFDASWRFDFESLKESGTARDQLLATLKQGVRAKFEEFRQASPAFATAKLVTEMRPLAILDADVDTVRALCALPSVAECSLEEERVATSKSVDNQWVRDGMRLTALISAGFSGSASGRSGSRVRIGVVELITDTHGVATGNFPRTTHVGWQDTMTGPNRITVVKTVT